MKVLNMFLKYLCIQTLIVIERSEWQDNCNKTKFKISNLLKNSFNDFG